MPIFVTVEPDEETRTETLLYANGMPMLAVNDASASVMFTAAPTADGARIASDWAGRLIRAANQFDHECRRFAEPRPDVGRDFSNSGPGLASLMFGYVDGGEQ